MIIRGRVQNGVVVFENDLSLPDGTQVVVIARADSQPPAQLLTEEQRRRLREMRKYFESLTNENPGDTFTGADHNRVLYGDG